MNYCRITGQFRQNNKAVIPPQINYTSLTYISQRVLHRTDTNLISTGKVKNINDWIYKTINNPVYNDSCQLMIYGLSKLLPYSNAVELIKSIFDKHPMVSADCLGNIGKDDSMIDFLGKKYSEIQGLLENNDLELSKTLNYKTTLKVIPRSIDMIKKRIGKG